MKNVRIERTANETFVVRYDTDRFGKDEIMFESFLREDCERYILRMASRIIRYSDKYAAREDAYEALIHFLPVSKKDQIVRACGRNAYFTSAWTLEWTEADCFDKGLYLTFRGVQTSVSVWIADDGNIGRRPFISLMNKIGHHSFHNCESSFKFMIDDLKEA